MTSPTMPGPMPNPLADRQRVLSATLRVALVVVFACSIMTLWGGAELSRNAGVTMVALLVGIPVVRILWLAVRWIRRRDLRFAALALSLVALAAIVAGTVAGIAPR